jgi:hypothetical protein
VDAEHAPGQVIGSLIGFKQEHGNPLEFEKLLNVDCRQAIPGLQDQIA